MTAAIVGGGLLTGSATAAPGKAHGRRNTVEIVASHDHASGDHHFHLDRTEVASGWTTFALDNRTDHTHFAYFAKLPEQALSDAAAAGMDPLRFYVETVTRPFQWFWDGMVGKDQDPADNTDIYDTLFPPWFGDVQFYGGPGLTSPHLTSRTTVALDQGQYIVECYVKDAANDFHSYLGMIDLLSVTGDDAGVPEPEPTLEVSLSTSGVAVDDTVRPGRHVVGVRVEDQQAYANLVGHDVHLIRLDDGVSLADVAAWMNWAEPSQFISDGTEPSTFLGGVQDIWTADLPRSGYLHVTLTPGDYAWVAEVPAPAAKGMLESFTVPSARGRGAGE